MNKSGRWSRVPADPATERGAFRPSFGYLLLALLLVGCGLYWLTSPTGSSSAADTSAARPNWPAGTPFEASAPAQIASTASAVFGIAAPAASGAQLPEREVDGDVTPDLRSYLNPGEKPTMKEVLDRLHAAGVHTGIGAFNPPDTRPNLVGLAVPKDFVLPDGYVRHFQTTDDGQDIEPILMYAPDREFLDAAGRPIAIPADRVVRPEQAPPGLPLRRVVIPAPVAPDK
ncbi:MAG: hypothetical protein RLZZ618_2466 [Pseudomonadota bacterium]